MDDATLAVIRSWAGSRVGVSGAEQYSLTDVEQRYARLGTPEAVALEILRQRRADFLADPVSLQLDGDMSHNTTENLRHLDRQIARLEALVVNAGAGTLAVGTLSRPDAVR